MMMTKLPPLSVLLAPHGHADLHAPSSRYHYAPASHVSTDAEQRRATPLYSYAYDQQPAKLYTSPPSPSSPSWFNAAPRAAVQAPPSMLYQQYQQPLTFHQDVLMASTVDSCETVTPSNVLQCPTPAPQAPATASMTQRRPKASRYLREMDRRAIIKRLDAGEKQCALAKEFNVSRSSICNLFKHRAEVLSRAPHLSPFSKHPKKKCKKNALRQFTSNSSSSTSSGAIGSSSAICV